MADLAGLELNTARAASGMLIRRFTRTDQRDVLRLHRAAMADTGLCPGDGVYYDDDLPHLEEVYLRCGGEFLVGTIGTELIAMGGLRRIDDATAEMVRVRVAPHRQRRGHGAAIVTALEARAREMGFCALRCDTTTRQTAALSLYRGMGWRETARRRVGGIVIVYAEKDL
jgi:ribosomal protein S18 acetylase RimI-like enzyme